MKKQVPTNLIYGHNTGPVTRAKAGTFASHGRMPLPRPPLQLDEKQTKVGRRKRVGSDENKHATLDVTVSEHKKRAVLKDISDSNFANHKKNYLNPAKMQIKACTQQVLSSQSKARARSNHQDSKFLPAFSGISELLNDDGNIGKVKEVQNVQILETQESTVSICTSSSVLTTHIVDNVSDRECSFPSALFEDNRFRGIQLKEAVKGILSENHVSLSCLEVQDIDSDLLNPQMCSLYASDIHTNLRIAELIWRPSSIFLEAPQRDITQRMRGILVDWLVEVAEEYRLVPDTLYLTVHFIDRFLSQYYIERQRLQLLGVTCMLIASKYEEICAPRVDEFCFITDNTYTKDDVHKMEFEVLNYLGFTLSVPTIKTFLRRFLRAAQTSYKAPLLPLGYMANYLAELTLVEYSFLKFLPSVIAASAVFLARWTLDNSDHPWNCTLEHYTSYKASDLECAILAMHDLQKISHCSSLTAIREKYLQEKYGRIADRVSPDLPSSLF